MQNYLKQTTHIDSGEDDMPEKMFTVLQAARKVFFQYGFSAATTDMIQKEAGVSKSTLYAHFQNKEGMLRAVIEYECKRQIDRTLQCSAEGKNIRERLFSLAMAYLELLMRPETLALFRMALEVSTVFPDLAELFYTSGPKRFFQAIQDVLERGVNNGELKIPRRKTLPVARLFASMVRGEPYVRQLLFPEKQIPKEDLEAGALLAVDTFLAAYGTL